MSSNKSLLRLMHIVRSQKTNLITLSVLSALAIQVAAADWPQYRGPNHDGISAEKIATSWPADGLKAVWKTPMTDGFSSLAIGNGMVFTLVKRTVDNEDQEVCVGFNADTGKELWVAPLGIAKYDDGGGSGAPDNRGGDGPRSTPSFDEGNVYVLSAQLKLVCFEASTGKPLWAKDILKEYGGKMITWQSAASPLVLDQWIFVNGVAPGKSLMAFNKKDGSLAWAAQDDKMTHATPISATILGARQVIFFTQSGLVSVAPENGNVLWRYKFPYNVSTAASPVVAGDIVYCSAGYNVGGGAAKISKTDAGFTATEIWRTPNKNINHWSTPVYQDGYLYGPFSFKEFGKGAVKCIEVATGKEMWSKDGFGPGGVLLVNGNLLILSDKGELVLAKASPKEYQETARFQAIAGKCWNVPAIANGRIYARSTKEGGCFEVK